MDIRGVYICLLFSFFMRSSEAQRQRLRVRWDRQRLLEARKSLDDSLYRRLLLVRLIGFLQGDGCIVKKKNLLTHEFGFDTDHVALAHLFVDTFASLYGRKPHIHNLGNYFRVRITHKVASEELLALGKFKTMEWEIPSLCNVTERFVEWLRAYFDCEAYVSKKTIVVNSVNKKGLNQVKNALNSLGIISRWYEYQRKQINWNRNYILHIGRRQDRQTFLNRVGFNHPIKQRKLEQQFAAVA